MKNIEERKKSSQNEQVNVVRRRRKYACLVVMFVFVPFSSYWRDKCVCLLLWTNFHVPAQSFVLNLKAVHRCVHCLPYIHIEQKRVSMNSHRGRFSIFFDTRQYSWWWSSNIFHYSERTNIWLVSFIRVWMYVCRRAKATCTRV